MRVIVSQDELLQQLNNLHNETGQSIHNLNWLAALSKTGNFTRVNVERGDYRRQVGNVVLSFEPSRLR